MNPTSRRRVALFGGTFDPVHLGHLEAARAAVEACALDEVVFVPCRLSPHKEEGSAGASAEARFAMLELAAGGIPWVLVSDDEIGRPPPSYSWETAERFHRTVVERDGDELLWVLGTDQWQALPRWARPDRLAELVDFIVVGRGGPGTARPTPHPGIEARFRFVEFDHPASATEIRQAVADGRGDAVSDWLDPAVAQYVEVHGLYQ